MQRRLFKTMATALACLFMFSGALTSAAEETPQWTWAGIMEGSCGEPGTLVVPLPGLIVDAPSIEAELATPAGTAADSIDPRLKNAGISVNESGGTFAGLSNGSLVDWIATPHAVFVGDPADPALCGDITGSLIETPNTRQLTIPLYVNPGPDEMATGAAVFWEPVDAFSISVSVLVMGPLYPTKPGV